MMSMAVSSFFAMNFTGSTTFTSLSGVKKEMRIALPLQIAASLLGLLLFTLGKIF
jgi:acetyl-CoA decarbonylase/synthase complex subunit gamma